MYIDDPLESRSGPVPSLVTAAFFYAVIVCQLYSIGTLVLSIANPALRMWPPPEPGTRRYTLTRITMPLGPIATVGLFVVGALDWNAIAMDPWLRFAVGGCLLAPGGFFALWGYFGLGAEASTGAERDLMATGAYRYSRNPQYSGSIVSLVGYALVCNSSLTLIASGLGVVSFTLIPFAEEPWLRERLGAAYEAYCARVPRFLPSLVRPRAVEP